MASRGWKLPHKYDVLRIIKKREPTKAEILRKEMQELKDKLVQLQVAKKKPKTSFEESICVLPFNRSLYMLKFPRYIEVPKYNQYDVKGDYHDHV